MTGPKRISAEEFDRQFDEGKESIPPYLDLSKARRPNLEIKRVNVDLAQGMIDAIDREAARLGVTRQSVIKTWLAEKIEERQAKAPAEVQEAPVRRRHVAEPRTRYRAKKRRRTAKRLRPAPAATPLALTLLCIVSQGSRFAATPGFGPEPLWGS